MCRENCIWAHRDNVFRPAILYWPCFAANKETQQSLEEMHTSGFFWPMWIWDVLPIYASILGKKSILCSTKYEMINKALCNMKPHHVFEVIASFEGFRWCRCVGIKVRVFTIVCCIRMRYVVVLLLYMFKDKLTRRYFGGLISNEMYQKSGHTNKSHF